MDSKTKHQAKCRKAVSISHRFPEMISFFQSDDNDRGTGMPGLMDEVSN